MKKIFRYVMPPLLVGLALTFGSCDEDTAFVGSEIMPGKDNVSTSQNDYNVYSKSIKVDSVLANTNDCYLGSIIDPETRAKTSCGFLAQFHVMDNYKLPDMKRMITDEQGKVIADSCDIRIAFDKYYGDSLMTMKLYVHELDTNKVMKENVPYYTNLNPMDYVKTDGGLHTSLAYTIKDLTRPETETDGSKYLRSVVVRLPAEYGSYILNKYYENPKNFKNSYQFIHHVCAGFYFNTEGSVGSMINAEVSTMNVYFRYHTTNAAGNDTIIDGLQRMGATQEVLQNTHIENMLPEGMIDENNGYTYVKSPTGIFTEVEFPVSEIVAGEHYTDTINGAKISFRKHNDEVDSYFRLSPPSDMLMVRKGVAFEFFEKRLLPDSKSSYLASFNPITNSYIYANIGQMLTIMKLERDMGAGVLPTDSEDVRKSKYVVWEKENPDWNKVLMIPVQAEYTTKTDIYGYPSKSLMSLSNSMDLNSVKLEGGNSNSLKMTVIYSRFEK